jgi:hypothetical protein
LSAATGTEGLFAFARHCKSIFEADYL